MTPGEVDATPIWKLAAFLGADIDRTPPPDGVLRKVPSGRDLAAEYAAFERGEGPEPEARPIDLSAMPGWMVEGLDLADPPGGA